MARRERVTDANSWEYPNSFTQKEPETVTLKVSIKLGDAVYDNAEITFQRSDLRNIVHNNESYTGNWGGGFGE